MQIQSFRKGKANISSIQDMIYPDKRIPMNFYHHKLNVRLLDAIQENNKKSSIIQKELEDQEKVKKPFKIKEFEKVPSRFIEDRKKWIENEIRKRQNLRSQIANVKKPLPNIVRKNRLISNIGQSMFDNYYQDKINEKRNNSLIIENQRRKIQPLLDKYNSDMKEFEKLLKEKQDLERKLEAIEKREKEEKKENIHSLINEKCNYRKINPMPKVRAADRKKSAKDFNNKIIQITNPHSLNNNLTTPISKISANPLVSETIPAFSNNENIVENINNLSKDINTINDQMQQIQQLQQSIPQISTQEHSENINNLLTKKSPLVQPDRSPSPKTEGKPTPKVVLPKIEKANSKKSTERTTNSAKKRKNDETYQKHKDFGKVPEYIKKYELEAKLKKEEEEMEKMLKSMPPGTRLLSEEERVQTLNSLIKSKKETEYILERLPITTRTLAMEKKKRDVMQKLADIDKGIEQFSKKKVFVTADN